MENFRLFVVLCSVFYVASDASLLACLLSFVLVHCSAELYTSIMNVLYTYIMSLISHALNV